MTQKVNECNTPLQLKGEYLTQCQVPIVRGLEKRSRAVVLSGSSVQAEMTREIGTSKNEECLY